NNMKRRKQKANTSKPASSPPLNAPAQALSGDETKRPMALVNADREIVRKIMTEPGPRWEPQSPAEGRKCGQLFGRARGRPMQVKDPEEDPPGWMSEAEGCCAHFDPATSNIGRKNWLCEGGYQPPHRPLAWIVRSCRTGCSFFVPLAQSQ